MFAIILSSLSLCLHFVVIGKICGEFDVCLIHISTDFTIFRELSAVGGLRCGNHIVKQQFCQVSIYLWAVIRFCESFEEFVAV